MTPMALLMTVRERSFHSSSCLLSGSGTVVACSSRTFALPPPCLFVVVVSLVLGAAAV